MLEGHGLNLDLWRLLEYRHLPLDGGRRSLYVRPALPWPHTGRGLGDAVHAYAAAGVNRCTAADLLPPHHWVW